MGAASVQRLRAYSRGMSGIRLASGLTLSCADRGDASGPAVLMLPGPTDSWRSYQPVLDLLPDGVRAIAVSQRGHGESGKPEGGYRVEAFAADVVPLLDALNIEQAVLEDPISPDVARSLVVATSSENVVPELVDRLVEDVLAVPAHVWKETFAGLLAYDDQAELPLIDARTLLVWGDADTLVSREMQHQLARSIPDASLRVYSGVGHTPRWEDPARFSTELVAFAQGRWP